MNIKPILTALFCLFAVATAHAQWQTTTYSLKGGWNAIYLTGDAPQDALTNLFPTQVLEVWRWNTNPTQVQFMESPSSPSAGTPEWSVWKRGFPAESDFSQLTGQTAYLVKCSGTTANTYSAAIPQIPLPPRATWVRNGANLMGFPTRLNGSYPSISNYFATFPAAIAANSKIFKYIGGELSTGNPMQVFSPSAEPLDRTRAYWFSAEVVENFQTPLEISLSNSAGLDFGSSGSIVTVRIRNRSATEATLTLEAVASEPSPSGQPSLTPVPLTKRIFNPATLIWDELPISTAYDETIPGLATVELQFGINRTQMTPGPTANWASFLRLTDGGNLMDVMLPVRAQPTVLTGLWAGDIQVTNVDSRVETSGRAIATATVNGSGGVSGLSISNQGFNYDLTPVVTVPDTLDLNVGMTVIGSGITGSTTLSSILGDTRLRLAQSPPDGSVVLSFGQALLATTSTGDSTVSVSSTAGLTEGMAVVGTGIVGTAGIVSIPNATTLVLSQALPAATNELLYGAVVMTAQVRTPEPPTVVIAAPPGAGGEQATATASVSNGVLSGFTITSGGSGYAVSPAKPPQVTVTAPVPGSVPRPYTLRTLLHVSEGEVAEARLLSQVFQGRLNQAENLSGLCTKEIGLHPDDKGSALRFSVAHLPLDLVLDSNSPGSTGDVAFGSTLVRTVVVPFNDPTNPFVHQYHPDHDNRDARPDGTNTPKGNGDESHTVTRTCSFTFTATPPEGVSATGWGSSVIGGQYTEILRGLHRDALVVSGTFVLRRVSETGALTLNN